MRKKILVLSILVIVTAMIFSLAFCDNDRKKKDELYRQVELFADTLAIVQNNYVDETKPKDLIYGALKGMLSSLDPHSQFLTPDDYVDLKTETAGKFGGLGLEVSVRDGLLTVISPIEDTPAWKAGIKANDKIVKINNEVTKEMTLSDAVKKMRGKPGETVDLIVLREAEKRIIEFHITRDVIKVKDIKDVRILEDEIGYIRLVEFSENTAKDLEVALDKLKKDGAKALILDLRNNPGGLLEQAVKVAGIFLEKGKLIVYTKSKQVNSDMEFKASFQNPTVNIPLIIMINQGSASGSEIVAGALQDHKRALILGVKSFGKGSVQTVIPLSDGSALRLTTSKYFTPSGKVIHGNGVMPDIVVEEGKIELAGTKKTEINKVEDVFEELEKKEKKAKNDKLLEYRSDNQLMRALDTLKVVKIYEATKK